MIHNRGKVPNFGSAVKLKDNMVSEVFLTIMIIFDIVLFSGEVQISAGMRKEKYDN